MNATCGIGWIARKIKKFEVGMKVECRSECIWSQQKAIFGSSGNNDGFSAC
jgi:hypothetical protein